MTAPRSGKAASAHIRQIGPERYHGLRIKVNGARLRARARRLCGAPPLGCPLPPVGLGRFAARRKTWLRIWNGQTPLPARATIRR
jgi:hypothetical protein